MRNDLSPGHVGPLGVTGAEPAGGAEGNGRQAVDAQGDVTGLEVVAGVLRPPAEAGAVRRLRRRDPPPTSRGMKVLREWRLRGRSGQSGESQKVVVRRALGQAASGTALGRC